MSTIAELPIEIEVGKAYPILRVVIIVYLCS